MVQVSVKLGHKLNHFTSFELCFITVDHQGGVLPESKPCCDPGASDRRNSLWGWTGQILLQSDS